MLVCWFVGLLVVGLLVCWFVGVLVCWFVGLLVCWFVCLFVVFVVVVVVVVVGIWACKDLWVFKFFRMCIKTKRAPRLPEVLVY